MKNAADSSLAIEKSKSFFGRVASEPLVSTKYVLLREVVHSLEIVWGFTQKQLETSCDPKAPQLLNDALCSGDLVARVYTPGLDSTLCPIIPAVAWRKISPEKGEDAFNNGFWMYAIRYPQDCEGYAGELPFIVREDAEAWLSASRNEINDPSFLSRFEKTKSQGASSRETFRSEEELERWYREVQFPLFQATKMPNHADREKAIVARDAVGHGVKRDRAREIRKRVEPIEVRTSGRRADR